MSTYTALALQTDVETGLLNRIPFYAAKLGKKRSDGIVLDKVQSIPIVLTQIFLVLS